jgi:hypothetical protein
MVLKLSTFGLWIFLFSEGKTIKLLLLHQTNEGKLLDLYVLFQVGQSRFRLPTDCM